MAASSDFHVGGVLTLDQIVPDLVSQDQAGVIAELVEKLDALGLIPREERGPVLTALLTKEHSTGTVIGSGVAIPHCYSSGVTEPVFVYGRSQEGVDFSAPDGELVRSVLLFVSPADRHLLHLQALKGVAEIFRSSRLRQQLLDSADASGILEAFRREGS